MHHNLPAENWGLAATMLDYLCSRELAPTLALRNRWYPSDSAGDGAPRVVIPASGHLTTGFWQARLMDDAWPGAKRWQSPHGTRGDAIVIAWPRHLGSRAVVVEGPMCALAAAELGFIGVSMLGAAPPRAAVAYAMGVLSGCNTIVVPDRDRPDLLAKLVANFATVGRAHVRVPTTSKDLAEMSRKQREVFLG